jgi:DNA-binding PadR family transcriptional regulator
MQEPTYLILAALVAGPQHGYGIMAEAEALTGGRVRLRAGTLYTALDRLVADGLLAVDREEVVDARFRRYYRLTDAGAQRLTAETEVRRQQALAVTRRLRAAGLARGARVAGEFS